MQTTRGNYCMTVSSIPRAMGRHNKLDLNRTRQPRSRSKMHGDAQRWDKRDAVQNLCCISTIFTNTEFGCVCVCVCVCVRARACCVCVWSSACEKERGRVSEWVSERESGRERATERAGERERPRENESGRERESERDIVYSLSVSSWHSTYTENSQIHRNFRYFIGFWKARYMIHEHMVLWGVYGGFYGVLYNFCV